MIRILQNEEEIPVLSENINSEFIRLAKIFPEELVFWVADKYADKVNIANLEGIFHHDLIMCSFPVENQYLSEKIGYIDQWPFVKPDYTVSYPTWRMSPDMGGIKGKTFLIFESLIKKNYDFGYTITSIAKLGQQNGLLSYSEPRLLLGIEQSKSLNHLSGDRKLFKFVYQHYKWPWIFILFYCLLKFEKKIPLASILLGFFSTKRFKRNFELDNIDINSNRFLERSNSSIDVIIPTLGRPTYLKQVLIDLREQTLVPSKVIVVEQNPDIDSNSELLEINEMEWPFELIHFFIHEAGACNARNLALKEVTADWVFFADDDIRVSPDVLSQSLKELVRMGVDCLNINCKQPNQETVFHKVKQWGSFGAGTSVLNSSFAVKTKFSHIYENGYGEDQDYGMQLRKQGCDIIYHPQIEILHLKAERGGFRERSLQAWDDEQTKPSPTVLLYAWRYFSREQIHGYKAALFIKYYFKQNIKNPFRYVELMRERWRQSEKWAKKLNEKNKVSKVI